MFASTSDESFALHTHPYQCRICNYESPHPRLSLYAVLLYQHRPARAPNPNPLATLHTGFQAR